MRTLKLGGQTFKVFPLPNPYHTFAYQPLIGPPVLELLGFVEKLPQLAMLGGSDADVMRVLPVIAPVLSKALQAISPENLETILNKFFEPVMVETSPGIEVPMATAGKALMVGRTVDMWRLLLACIQENYGDFFDLLPGKDATAPEGSASKASTT